MKLDFFDELFKGFGMADTSWGGSIKIFSLVFLTFMVSFIVGKVFNQLQKHFDKTNNLWDDTILWAARKPVSTMIWIVGLSLSAAMADHVADTEFYTFAEPVARLGLIAMIDRALCAMLALFAQRYFVRFAVLENCAQLVFVKVNPDRHQAWVTSFAIVFERATNRANPAPLFGRYFLRIAR